MTAAARTLVSALAVLLWGEFSCSQELSTLIFPSEDEMLEALRIGEIDYPQYVMLKEIIYERIDPANRYLFDRVPNLAFFQVDSTSLTTALELEQQRAFVDSPTDSARHLGSVRYCYCQSLEEENEDRYRLSAELHVNRRWRGSFKIHREYGGSERLVSRTFAYRGNGGILRRLELGTCNVRMGLGTVFGYRGKLLDFSGRLDGESFLFPDYGGFNGVYAEAAEGDYLFEGLGSFNRDTAHSLLSMGAMVSHRRGRFQPALIFGVNRLACRSGSRSVWDAKGAVSSSLSYRNGYNSLEITGRIGDRLGAGAVVTEGRHRSGPAEVKYAAWAYGDRFLDLSSGSKAAPISNHMTVEEADFEYSGKRPGQEGLLLKTVLELESGWAFSNSAVFALKNYANRSVQLLSELRRQWTASLSVQVDCLVRQRAREGTSDYDAATDRRIRLEARFQSGGIAVRSYIGHGAGRGEKDYLSIFGSLRGPLSAGASLEVWSHWSRIRGGRVEDWHMFVKLRRKLSDRLWFTTRFTNTYQRVGEDGNQPVVWFELETIL